MSTAVMTLAIVYKGAPSLGLKNLGSAGTAAAVVGSAAVVALLSILFWVPFVYCKVARKDYSEFLTLLRRSTLVPDDFAACQPSASTTSSSDLLSGGGRLRRTLSTVPPTLLTTASVPTVLTRFGRRPTSPPMSSLRSVPRTTTRRRSTRSRVRRPLPTRSRSSPRRSRRTSTRSRAPGSCVSDLPSHVGLRDWR